MISVYRWNAPNEKGQWLDLSKLKAQKDELRTGTHGLWIDLEDPDEEEEKFIFQEFLPIHPLSLEDVTKPRREPESHPHFPKAEEFHDYLLVIVNPLTQRLLELIRQDGQGVMAEERVATQLSAVLTRRVLITHHYQMLPSIESLKQFLLKHASSAQRGPDYLFHLVLDSMVDEYAEVLDHFTDTLDNVELQVFDQPTQQLLLLMLQLKRRIIQVRKTLVYEREVLARMVRGEFNLINDRERVYYRNVYDHLVRFTELIESSREMVSDLMQTHLAAASNRLNGIMKVLTMISTVVLPMTLIAGVYGMNFDFMPELHQAWGYPFSLTLMFFTGIGSFLYFRWKKWF